MISSTVAITRFNNGNFLYLGVFYDPEEELLRTPTFNYADGALNIPLDGSYELPNEVIASTYPGTERPCWLYRIKITGGNRTYESTGMGLSPWVMKIRIPAIPGYTATSANTAHYNIWKNTNEIVSAIKNGTIIIPPTN